MFRSSRARSSERGAAALEFALVVPLLIVLVFGIIDFGWAINRNTVINNATREAVRVASLGGTVAEINASVNATLAGSIVSGTPTITVTCVKANGSACTSYSAEAVSGATAVVTVTSSQNWLTPVGRTFSTNLTLTKSSRMRIE